MKECELISQLFFKVHDNSANHKEMETFNSHLGYCENCREEFRWYGSTINALSSLEEVQPPPDFLFQLHQRLDQTKPSLIGQIRDFLSGAYQLPAPAGAAALTVILVACLFLYNDGALLSNLPFVSSLSAQDTRPGLEMSASSVGMPRAGLGAFNGESMGRPKSMSLAVNSSASSPLPKTEIPKERLRQVATVADILGADNLTVESNSIDSAVESVKRMLPNIEGRILAENIRDSRGEKVLRVMIPSRAYGDLTTELINHGAVASGAGSDYTPPTVANKSRDQVLLYIKFTHAH